MSARLPQTSLSPLVFSSANSTASITSTLPKSWRPQLAQNPAVAHSSQNTGGVPPKSEPQAKPSFVRVESDRP